MAGERGPGGSEDVQRIGVAEGTLGGAAQFASLAALFPAARFIPLVEAWPERLSEPLDIMIVGADASEVEAVLPRLKAAPRTTRVIVILKNADVLTTRRLIREGAADVLLHPATEPALSLSLERLIGHDAVSGQRKHGRGEVVVFLKAGGGVGATALATQVAAILAIRNGGGVCLADMDIQFGTAALYLDMPDTVTLQDLLASGEDLEDTPFATALGVHPTGARVLAAPQEVVALETVSPSQADAVVKGLRRDFVLTLIDLPSVWTAWTYQILTHADRVVLVTQLSVPHMQLVKRQLRTLAMQNLGDKPVILVCNAPSADQSASVSLKAAERALGRSFDIVIPEDRRLMNTAVNHGLELSAVRRNTKLEKAMELLADRVGENIAAAPLRSKR